MGKEPIPTAMPAEPPGPRKRRRILLILSLCLAGAVMVGAVAGLVLYGLMKAQESLESRSVDRTADVMSSVLTAARAVAVSGHEFVAVLIEDGRVTLHEFGGTGDEPPVDVEDRIDSPDDDARQDRWRKVAGIRSWKVEPSVVLVDGNTPFAERLGRESTRFAVLIAPNGMVLEGVRISPLGNREETGTPRRRLLSVVRFKCFRAAEVEQQRRSSADEAFKDFVIKGGRTYEVDRVTAQMLESVPSEDP